VAQGAGIAAVIAAPAEGNLEPGMVITAVNGTRVRAVAEFERAMALTRANQTVEVAVYRKGEGELHFSLTLTDKYAATNREADRGKGLLGVRPASTETSIYNPFAVSSFPDFLRASLTLIFLPFTGLVPIQDPIAQFYSVGGGWGVLPEPFFWLLANTIYWLFWINLMLGMTNALPAVPLDGGYLFKDLFDGFLKRVKANMGLEARERVTRNLSYILALFILALVVWQIIGPRYFGAGP
jgi:membrane-associated protease RseP (regulator of RpoE activity)